MSKHKQDGEFLQKPETLYSYLAGIIDGEGALYIARHVDKRKPTHSYQYNAQVVVSSTSEPLVNLLRETFGGKVYAMNMKHWKSYQPHYKPAWLWKCTTNLAMDALRKMYPYLLVKKKHAEILFEFEKTIIRTRDENGRWHHISPENLQEKEKCYLAIKELNIKGKKSLGQSTSASLASQRSSQSELV